MALQIAPEGFTQDFFGVHFAGPHNGAEFGPKFVDSVAWGELRPDPCPLRPWYALAQNVADLRVSIGVLHGPLKDADRLQRP